MKDYKIKFIEKIFRTDSVVSFKFIPNEKIDFLAGQFSRFFFDEENINNADLNKFLSFSCAPGKDYIEFTKKISDSSFSKKLISLEAGDEVLIKAPMGKDIYNGGSDKIAFLIGGIGITPAISIIEYIVNNKLDTDAVLLYSNWTERDIAFRKEIDEWSKIDKLKVLYKIIYGAPSKNISIGVIDDQYVRSVMSDYKDRIIYIYGPSGMVNAMNQLCEKIDCDKDKVIKETFTGY